MTEVTDARDAYKAARAMRSLRTRLALGKKPSPTRERKASTR